MKVLVTGVAGFIGSHFAESVAKAGHTVYGVDNLSPYYDPAIKEINIQDITASGVRCFRSCLTENPYDHFPQDIDYIVHFAAQPGISETTSFALYEHNNIKATQRLIEWAKSLPSLKLFVNISTSSVYGLQATAPEDEAPKPISHYGVTKLAAEQLVMAEQRLGKLNACSARLFSVYGPRERPEKLYTRLIKSILEETPFPLYEGSERHERSFTYVGDIVKGLERILELPEKCNGKLINLGSETVHTTAEGIALIEQLIGAKAQIEVVAKRPGDQLRTAANIDKAKRLLDYSPGTPFETGLSAQINWYKEKFHSV